MAMRAAKRRKKNGRGHGTRGNSSVAQGIVDVQVLGTGANGLSPSIVLQTNQGHYLFNVGDGLQRFCMQHKVRMGRIKGMFLTNLRSESTGGLPGSLLTIADLAGASQESEGYTRASGSIDIHGPSGTGFFINSMLGFYARSSFGLEVTEHTSHEHSTSRSYGGLDCLQAVVLYVVFH